MAVFLASPDQWRQHDWGPRRIAFLIDNLKCLGKDLARVGIPLIVVDSPTFGDAPRDLLEVTRRFGCETLFFNLEYEYNESSRDRQVVEQLESQGVEVRSYHEQTIVKPGALTTGQGTFYSVFTPFWRKWCSTLEDDATSTLPVPQPVADEISSRVRLPQSMGSNAPQHTEAPTWIVGERAARQQLRRFLRYSAAHYDQKRDSPSAAGTSSLSAALALGILSPRVALARAVAANGGSLSGTSPGIGSWIRQLAWRDFYRHVVVGFPRVSRGRSFLSWADGVDWRQDDGDLDAWREGRTGVPLVDAGMRQLSEVGWLHNRVRMVTAMYLSKDLLLDWRLGEAHFMQQLVDGDFSNNNGGWQWSASTGVDAAPYFRIMNPWTQARRFDPDGAYIKAWVPELEAVSPRVLHEPKKLAAEISTGSGYPEPLVDHRAARIRAIAAFEKAK